MRTRNLVATAAVLFMSAVSTTTAQNLVTNSTFGELGNQGVIGTSSNGMFWSVPNANGYCPWSPFRRAGSNFTFRAVNRCDGFPSVLNPYTHEQMLGGGLWDLTETENQRYALFSMQNGAPAPSVGGVYNRLAATTIPGETYTLDFWYAFRQFGLAPYLTNTDSVRLEFSNILVDAAPFNQPLAQVTQSVNLGITGPTPGAGSSAPPTPGCGQAVNSPNVTWVHHTTQFVATGQHQFAGLAFYFSGNKAVFVYLDDIRLTRNGSNGQTCSLDVDYNGVFNGADMQLLCSLNGTGINCGNQQLAHVDVDGNGVISFADVAELVSTSCGNCELPPNGVMEEPSSQFGELEIEGIEPMGSPKQVDLVLHPNPTNGKFRLSAPLTDELARRITVYDAQGKVVLTMSPTLGEIPTIDLEGSPNGAYMVTVQDGGTMRSLRLVKE